MQQTVYLGLPDDSVRNCGSVPVARANNPVFFSLFFSLSLSSCGTVCSGGKISSEFTTRLREKRR